MTTMNVDDSRYFLSLHWVLNNDEGRDFFLVSICSQKCTGAGWNISQLLKFISQHFCNFLKSSTKSVVMEGERNHTDAKGLIKKEEVRIEAQAKAELCCSVLDTNTTRLNKNSVIINNKQLWGFSSRYNVLNKCPLESELCPAPTGDSCSTVVACFSGFFYCKSIQPCRWRKKGFGNLGVSGL